jgi:diphosphomevalonate decarboxylase
VDLIAVTGTGTKKISSTEGHGIAQSSPFYKTRIKGMPGKISELKKALKKKDFTKFGRIIEAEAINMHMVMMTSNPPLYYWTPETLKVMAKVIELRGKGIESYFTIDAGPNVHIICEKETLSKLKLKIAKIPGVKKILINSVSKGAGLVL